ncbi:thiamine pyrophosphate-dependent enzyme [Rhodoferax sediminis]|uniref:Thiamine pyrophosphate-binding protein n=1 Tax=Rhodoferax sediminis TaxID=2509614 RepID=A0A515DDJ1_9BURK|nr:thiamine pyrophosphate-dependent enzyme [Rhodoferax sediminis]QDL38467.1 thiamine pyrophosphate-binding protein [Rhodoferax sediminis]
MNILSACDAISRARHDAVLVATMGAMNAFDRLGAGQPRINSVPLMGGAPSIGLGIALAQSAHKVIVVDGDASLLMQLGSLVTVAGQQPRNFYHFVIHNGTQFTGLSNLPLAGDSHLDFTQMAEAAGYRRVHRHDDLEVFSEALPGLLAEPGPTLVELVVESDAPVFGPDHPQQDWADLQFTRMGDEASKLANWLLRK